jgi:hypothetical protein
MTPRVALVLVASALCAASCRATPTESQRAAWERGSGIRRELKDYLVIDSVHTGKVGYLKVYDVVEFGGPPYRWTYVYDRNWRELGFINQFGGATMYHYFSPSEEAVQNRTLRATQLPSDSIERNVMRMLGIDPATDDVVFRTAERIDVAGAPATAPLAGPGIVPAKAPVAPEPAPAAPPAK